MVTSNRPIQRYSDYTRADVHDTFEPETAFTPNAGDWGRSGIVTIPSSPDDVVFFVTFGQRQGDHAFDEGITKDGVLTWQSQPSQKLSHPRIKRLVGHDDAGSTIHLFLRTSPRRTQYTYLGRLRYRKHDRQREMPVYFEWQILDWAVPDNVLARMGLTLTDAEDRDESGGFNPPAGGRRDSGKRGQGHATSAEERKAIERRAVAVARQHYGRVYAIQDVGNHASYDLLCTSTTRPELHVEVKGTRGDGASVIVTAGEVKHARRFDRVSLVVVSQIFLTRGTAGRLVGRGGVKTVLDPWDIDQDGQLEATEYRYELGSSSVG